MTRNRELIPVEVKWSDPLNGKARWDHEVQLAAYALLLEENLGSTVKRGYVYYLKGKKLVEVLIDEGIKSVVRRILKEMQEMVLEERDPGVRASVSKCINCGYLNFCRPGLAKTSENSYISKNSPVRVLKAGNPENRLRKGELCNRRINSARRVK